MDKKKINTILILAVASIWGVLLYKFVASLFVDKDYVAVAEIPIAEPLVKVGKKDTVQLHFPDRDPFLDQKTFAIKTPKKKVAKRNVKQNTKPLKPITWPKIQYLGFVKSNSSKSRLGLVRIGEKLHRVNTNEQVDGLRIKKITNDEIVVLNGKDERIFAKN